MIEEELLEILNKDINGEALNSFVDRFRGGSGDVSQLLTLLRSKYDDVVSFGAYIFNEITLQNFEITEKVIVELNRVINESSNSEVRLQALISIAPLIEKQDYKKAKEIYLMISQNDIDEDVKGLAIDFLNSM